MGTKLFGQCAGVDRAPHTVEALKLCRFYVVNREEQSIRPDMIALCAECCRVLVGPFGVIPGFMYEDSEAYARIVNEPVSAEATP